MNFILKNNYKEKLINDAILTTVAYSDLFAFPLTKTEIWYFLKSNTSISIKDFKQTIMDIQIPVIRNKSYYQLEDNDDLLLKRLQRKKTSKQKLAIAKKACLWLSLIPTVYFIGISGSLAFANADAEDDIDLFIITKKNTIWFTRLLSIFFLQILALRRKRNSINAANKICLNMIIDESAIPLPQKRRDVYTAHEIAQLLPVFERKNSYKRFVLANKWTDKLMPNLQGIATRKKILLKSISPLHTLISSTLGLSCILIGEEFMEYISRKVQIQIMNKHRTSEIINDNYLMFHPFDYRHFVIKRFMGRLLNAGVEYNPFFDEKIAQELTTELLTQDKSPNPDHIYAYNFQAI